MEQMKDTRPRPDAIESDDQVVDRDDLVKGYELGKEQYIRVTEEELEALEGEASKDIDIAEFVPLPPWILSTGQGLLLGPDKGGAKPYQLLARALEKAEEVASPVSSSAGRKAWSSSAPSRAA